MKQEGKWDHEVANDLKEIIVPLLPGFEYLRSLLYPAEFI